MNHTARVACDPKHALRRDQGATAVGKARERDLPGLIRQIRSGDQSVSHGTAMRSVLATPFLKPSFQTAGESARRRPATGSSLCHPTDLVSGGDEARIGRCHPDSTRIRPVNTDLLHLGDRRPNDAVAGGEVRHQVVRRYARQQPQRVEGPAYLGPHADDHDRLPSASQRGVDKL